jgi:hypothetical protein
MNFIYREIVEEPETTTDESTFGQGSDGSTDGSDSESSTRTSTTQAAAQPRLFAGTAGHCVDGVGARVSNRDGAFGTVAFHALTESGNNFDDVAFIEIDRAKEQFVNPKMLGFNGPTGVISGAGATEHTFTATG